MLKSSSFEVPFEKDAASFCIPWVIGLMVFLATLALVGGVTLSKAVDQWRASFSTGFTVELPPLLPQSPELEKIRQEKVLQILDQTPTVISADIVPKKALSNLFELNSDANPAEIPLPTLIDVSLEQDTLNLEDLNVTLAQAVPGALIRDHRQWQREAVRIAQSVIFISFLVAGFIGLAAIMTLIFVTYTGVEVHQKVVQVLHLVGARPNYIAKRFREHALYLALKGGMIGTVLAIGVLWALMHFISHAQIPFMLEGTPLKDIAFIVALTPSVALVLAGIVAHFTALAALAQRSTTW